MSNHTTASQPEDTMNKYTPHREWLEGLKPKQVAGILLVILWAAVLLVAFCAPGHSEPGRADGPDTCLPTDALQRAAAKVLRGDYDPVPAWKRAIYLRGQQEHITVQGRAKRTSYCPQCSGTTCADGSGVRPGIVSASPNVPMHSWVWLASDGLLKVCDRGGLVKVGAVLWKGEWVQCTRPGETANFDVWLPDCAGGCWTGPGTKRNVPWAIIPARDREAKP